MKKSLKKFLPDIILIGMASFVVLFYYGEVLVQSNDRLFSNRGDGLKNYYTYAYHIKHDTSFHHHTGMNYPYGEHYLYTDCHPLLANGFKLLSAKLHFFETHSIGILNALLILGIFLTFYVVFLLLVEMKMNKWISVFFSISMTLLAPQVFRLTGHLALSYSLAIPLTWLILVKIMKNTKRILCVLLFLNHLFWLLIHAYLGIIVIAFSLAILLVKMAADQNRRRQLIAYCWLGCATLLPVILFYAYTISTDQHLGRTNNPSGFFLYNAEFDDIFIPHGEPLRPILDQWTGGIIKLEWEARGYVGIVNTLFFIALIFLSLSSLFSKKARSLLKNIFKNKILNVSLIAGFVVVLFALAIPFKQFPEILEAFPIFKQFRATGRFVWPFYFAFSLFAAYTFQEQILWKEKNSRFSVLGIAFLILLCLPSCIEGLYYHQAVSQEISKPSNEFKTKLLNEDLKLALEQISPEDFQAIISLPFYYQGSESYSRPRKEEAVRNSLLLSYHTGLPNVCANLTRTSIEESKRIVQLLTPNYYEKKIRDDFKSKKPFLMVRSGKDLTKYENLLFGKAESIHKTEQLELLRLDFEQLFSDDKNKVILDFKNRKSQLYSKGSFLLSDSSSLLIYKNFESSASDTSFRGHGAFQSQKRGKNVLVEFPAHSFEAEKIYDMSIWMFNGEPDALNLWFRLLVEEYDEAESRWYTKTFSPEQAEAIAGDWSLVEAEFQVHDPGNKIFISTIGKKNSKASLHVDDILIREKGVDVFKMDSMDNSLFFNNHSIEMSN